MQNKIIEDIKGLGKVYLVEAPFDDEIKFLNGAGIKYPVSVRDASYTRLNGASQESKYGTRTCHAPICAKDSPTIIARISPLVTDSDFCRQVVKAHRANQYPVLDNDNSIYSKWEKIVKADKNKKPEKRRAIILPTREDYQIGRDSLEAEFLFEDTREEYFNRFVSGNSINAYQISENEIDSKEGTIVNYLWFSRPVDGSDLSLGNRGLGIDYGAFGVLRSREATEPSQKFLHEKLPYTKKELSRVLNVTTNIKQGNFKMSDLEKQIGKIEFFLT
ncbi:MAG: hypothetical protein NTZ83_06725, partial [Candidatus Pacearchaeota archaeon]|nr:hypothetical protein [Candidatus Pacearchaeota archaeon]